MFTRLLEVVRSSGVGRHLRKPVLYIPIVVVGMCGITALYRRFFQDYNMTKRRRLDSGESSPPKRPATRGSISTTAIEELAKYKSLEDFGYKFNEDGELLDMKTNKRFEFNVHPEKSYNQKRYERIGDLITEHVYDLLESEAKLKRVHVPLNAKEGDPTSFIFVSDDYKTNKDKLLVLIHGSGVVRAGQWARRLIINNNLSCGTQLPFIARARKEGYAVVVLNTNLNSVKVDGQTVGIRHNTRPEEHGKYVWKHIIHDLPAKNIAIVAHSYGGIVTTHMAREFADEFAARVFGIAFTDSVHNLGWQQVPDSITSLYVNKAQNWVASDDPLDTPIDRSRTDAPCVSAGHNTHEWTSWTSLDSIFKFFTNKYPAINDAAQSAVPMEVEDKDEEL